MTEQQDQQFLQSSVKKQEAQEIIIDKKLYRVEIGRYEFGKFGYCDERKLPIPIYPTGIDGIYDSKDIWRRLKKGVVGSESDIRFPLVLINNRNPSDPYIIETNVHELHFLDNNVLGPNYSDHDIRDFRTIRINKEEVYWYIIEALLKVM